MKQVKPVLHYGHSWAGCPNYFFRVSNLLTFIPINRVTIYVTSRNRFEHVEKYEIRKAKIELIFIYDMTSVGKLLKKRLLLCS